MAQVIISAYLAGLGLLAFVMCATALKKAPKGNAPADVAYRRWGVILLIVLPLMLFGASLGMALSIP